MEVSVLSKIDKARQSHRCEERGSLVSLEMAQVQNDRPEAIENRESRDPGARRPRREATKPFLPHLLHGITHPYFVHAVTTCHAPSKNRNAANVMRIRRGLSAFANLPPRNPPTKTPGMMSIPTLRST
jgi:hypothetical protein